MNAPVMSPRVPLELSCGLQADYLVRLPLDRFGIQNFYLTVLFRPTDSIW